MVWYDIYCVVQETGIDSMSEEGLTPVNFQPSVTFNNVKFVFPSRPEVQVSQVRVHARQVHVQVMSGLLCLCVCVFVCLFVCAFCCCCCLCVRARVCVCPGVEWVELDCATRGEGSIGRL